jgi:hypothetical protein
MELERERREPRRANNQLHFLLQQLLDPAPSAFADRPRLLALPIEPERGNVGMSRGL